MAWMGQACALLACFFLGALAVLVIYLIVIGRIDLTHLLSEANGDASMSRFQLLIFTFVVAISLFKLVELKGQFPDIPNGILTLLGISASTYAVGKGISYSAEVGINPKIAREAKKKADEPEPHA